MPKTLLTIGAHYDDCVFGVPGLMLQAVRKHYRVVTLSIIGDYRAWAPAKGRSEELLKVSKDLAWERGVEMRFLNYASMQFAPGPELNKAVAKVIAELAPDVALMLWHHDSHPDHEAASAISKMALRQTAAILGEPGARGARQIYCYDNGPRHTVGFEPNTYVDISADWPAAAEWLGRLMAFVREKPYDPQAPDGSVNTKETLARYRGAACGVRHAEAFWAMHARPVEIL